jgi:hypothetical protein
MEKLRKNNTKPSSGKKPRINGPGSERYLEALKKGVAESGPNLTDKDGKILP